MNAVATPEQVAAMTAKLSEFDVTVVLDTSGSMSDPQKSSNPTGPTRWGYMQEVMKSLVGEVMKVDDDGIDLITFGGAKIVTHNGVDMSKLNNIMASTSPGGSTPLAEALMAAVKCAGKSAKKDLIIVFTDGEPNDRDTAATVIKNQANSQAADSDLTFLFVQVGDNAGATAYLEHLDSGIKGAKFDIVDVKTINDVEKFATMQELLINAIVD